MTLQLTGKLNRDEAATVLAALRFWQEHRERGGSVPTHFDHFDDARELSLAYIDTLCETINLQSQPATIEGVTQEVVKALQNVTDVFELLAQAYRRDTDCDNEITLGAAKVVKTSRDIIAKARA